MAYFLGREMGVALAGLRVRFLNVVNRRFWATRSELSAVITYWIERTYHRKRRQRTLGKVTPIEYDTIMEPAVSIAA